MKTTRNCHYRLTDAGKTALDNRLHNLNAKQRQFLFMVQKKEAINQVICTHLSKTINIKQMVNLGLLALEQKSVDISVKNQAKRSAQKHAFISLDDLPSSLA